MKGGWEGEWKKGERGGGWWEGGKDRCTMRKGWHRGEGGKEKEEREEKSSINSLI